MLTQEFFYSRNQDHKLIQNIVFEYVSDNLESLITRHIRSNVTIPEILIKVDIFVMPRVMLINWFMD